MRAWEFLNESSGREPPITLRHLNNVKQDERWRAASHQRRLKRTRAMYANTAWQREQLEIERMRSNVCFSESQPFPMQPVVATLVALTKEADRVINAITDAAR